LIEENGFVQTIERLLPELQVLNHFNYLKLFLKKPDLKQFEFYESFICSKGDFAISCKAIGLEYVAQLLSELYKKGFLNLEENLKSIEKMKRRDDLYSELRSENEFVLKSLAHGYESVEKLVDFCVEYQRKKEIYKDQYKLIFDFYNTKKYSDDEIYDTLYLFSGNCFFLFAYLFETHVNEDISFVNIKRKLTKLGCEKCYDHDFAANYRSAIRKHFPILILVESFITEDEKNSREAQCFELRKFFNCEDSASVIKRNEYEENCWKILLDNLNSKPKTRKNMMFSNE